MANFVYFLANWCVNDFGDLLPKHNEMEKYCSHCIRFIRDPLPYM